MRVQQPIVALVFAVVGAWGQPQGAPTRWAGGTPLTPKAGALIDLTGYWASVVPEDSRFRMFTPPKSDFAGIPLNADGSGFTEVHGSVFRSRVDHNKSGDIL